MLLPGHEPEDDYQRWLRGEAVSQRAAEPARRTTDWRYGTLSATTDDKGRADLLALAGRWALAVSPSFAPEDSREEPHQELVSLPPSSLTVRVPLATRAFTGAVVDQHGRPVRDANVRILGEAADGRSSKSESTDEQGRFRFRGLPAAEIGRASCRERV